MKENWGILVIFITLLCYVVVVSFVEHTSISLLFPVVVELGLCAFLFFASLCTIPSVGKQEAYEYKGYVFDFPLIRLSSFSIVDVRLSFVFFLSYKNT